MGVSSGECKPGNHRIGTLQKVEPERPVIVRLRALAVDYRRRHHFGIVGVSALYDDRLAEEVQIAVSDAGVRAGRDNDDITLEWMGGIDPGLDSGLGTVLTVPRRRQTVTMIRPVGTGSS